MHRQRVATSAPYGDVVGYSRAVRAGNHIFVAGTTALGDDGKLMAVGDAYGQARRCFEIIVNALHELGATPDDVVRTRMFVKNPDDWQHIARAHAEVFSSIRPAATMVFSRFIEENMLCEIEAEAVVLPLTE